MRKIYYDNFFKSLSIFLFLFSLFVVYAASKASKCQKYIAIGMALFFILSSLFFLYQAYFVFFSYDNEAIYFGKQKKRFLWKDLIERGYSRLLDMNYIKFKNSKIIYSPYMYGFDEFSNFLEQKIQELDKYYKQEAI